MTDKPPLYPTLSLVKTNLKSQKWSNKWSSLHSQKTYTPRGAAEHPFIVTVPAQIQSRLISACTNYLITLKNNQKLGSYNVGINDDVFPDVVNTYQKLGSYNLFLKRIKDAFVVNTYQKLGSYNLFPAVAFLLFVVNTYQKLGSYN